MSFYTRRSFLKLSALSLLGLLTGKITPAQASQKLDVLFLRQIITQDSSTSRTIMWHSLQPHQHRLEYQLSNSSEATATLQPHTELFSLEDQQFYIHTARLTNLQAGSHYQYRVQQDQSTSPWYTLNTPTPDGPFTALIFPDSQCSDGYVTWQKVAQLAQERFPQGDFFVNMGDLVDNGAALYQWRQWFSAIANWMPQLPFAPVMGNHETYNLQWLCHLPKAFLRFFALPSNSSRQWQRYYYDFHWGPVHFIVLNTQYQELDDLQPGLMDEQLAWFQQTVANSSAPWQVVLMHKDIIDYDHYQNPEPLSDIDPVGKIFMPYFDRLGIHLVLTAHQHTYRRHGHIFNFQPDNKGPLYIDTGVAGNCRYQVPKTPRFDKIMLPQPEINNYLTISAKNQEITINCFTVDNQLADTCTLIQ